MIIGFDLSTSVCGYAILNEDGSLFRMDHIDLTKVKGGLWEKVDIFKSFLENLDVREQIKYVFIEEPLSKFSRRRSSAHTISLLMRFNGICSYLVHLSYNIDPVYYAPSEARKICKVTLLPKKKAKGLDQKHQTFEQMRVRPELAHIVWEKKRTGILKDWCYDRMDAYVIAIAGFNAHIRNTYKHDKVGQNKSVSGKKSRRIRSKRKRAK